jgi:hypothetical protein
MCRGKKICTELGTDIHNWDKYSPLRTPEWMIAELDLFISAVDDFLAGERDSCVSKIRQIRNEEITYWFIEHGQMSGRHRRIILKGAIPGTLDMAFRDAVRSPASYQNQVFIRDHFRCRYCGNRLISQDFFRAFIKSFNSPLFQRGKTNLTTHGIIHLAWPVADHVVPWNQGGRTDLSNLVSSCATCNYGKDGNTIEQIGIENPFHREPAIGHWNGLSEKVKPLREIVNAE